MILGSCRANVIFVPLIPVDKINLDDLEEAKALIVVAVGPTSTSQLPQTLSESKGKGPPAKGVFTPPQTLAQQKPPVVPKQSRTPEPKVEPSTPSPSKQPPPGPSKSNNGTLSFTLTLPGVHYPLP